MRQMNRLILPDQREPRLSGNILEGTCEAFLLFGTLYELDMGMLQASLKERRVLLMPRSTLGVSYEEN